MMRIGLFRSKTQLQTVMKLHTLLLSTLAIFSAAIMSSCATGPYAQYGTAVGGLGGAALGGVIGNQSGRPLEGAAIGAVAGGLVGNQIGAANDQYRYQQRGYTYAPQAAQIIYQQQPVYVQRSYGYQQPIYCAPSYPRYYSSPRTSVSFGFSSGSGYGRPYYGHRRHYRSCY